MADRTSAVIADEWPLVRLGIRQALKARGVEVVAESTQGEQAARRAASDRATYLIVGTVRDASLPDVARAASGTVGPPPRIILLLDQVTRDDLAALVALGVRGFLARSVSAEELADALDCVDRGERAVSPGLLPMLVGLLEVPGPAGGTAGLTRKEVEVLARLAEGRSNREIAAALYVTEATVKTHLTHIYTKLGVTDRRAALARAVSLGVLG